MKSTLAGSQAMADRLPAVDSIALRTSALVAVIRPVVGLILAVLLVIPV